MLLDDMSCEDKEYGCIFCKTGSEERVAQQLQATYAGLNAFAVTQVKHKSEKGVRSETKTILFPGYVFFVADPDCPAHLLKRIPNVLRLLSDSEDRWFLHGDNQVFARWIIGQDGLIGMSKAYREGDRVIFQTGPLKDYIGSVVKVDRHSRNGLVEIRFDDRVFRIWMAFEMVSPA